MPVACLANPDARHAAIAPSAAAPGGCSSWRLLPIIFNSGLTVELASWIEPVLHVRGARQVGIRFARQLSHQRGRRLTPVERDRLEPQEQAELDVAMLDRARTALADPRHQGSLVVLPLSFTGFSNGPARLKLTRVFSELSAADRASLILEIHDLQLGTPASRIVETIGFMRPYSRALIVRRTPVRSGLEALREARVRGVSLDDDGAPHQAGQVFGQIKLLRERSREIAAEVMAFGLDSIAMTQIAAAAGATFHSLRPHLLDNPQPA